MGASLRTARGVLGFVRDVRRDGLAATLRRLDLGDLVGRSLTDIFTGLTNVVCGDGGSIDEGIALDAWLETVADLDENGMTDAAALNDPGQMREVLITFITHSIENRLMQDIGTRGLDVAADVAAIDAFEEQLRDYIRGSVRDSLTNDLRASASLTDRQIREIVEATYRDAWDLLVAWGDAAQ